MWEYNYTNELYHHGVKGMKWGHRRANYYGDGKSTFRASNGVKVGAPKSRGVERFRKFQGSRVGGAMLSSTARLSGKSVYTRVKKENAAVRESNQAHNATNKQPMSTKKKVAIGAAAVAGTALAAYSVNKLVKNKNSKIILAKGRQAAQQHMHDNYFTTITTFKNGTVVGRTASGNTQVMKFTGSKGATKGYESLKSLSKQAESRAIDIQSAAARDAAAPTKFSTAARNVGNYYKERARRKIINR